MKRLLSLLLLLLVGNAWGASRTWLEVDIGIIGTASEDILDSAMAEVIKHGYAGLVIKLDTPGGSLENTRAMVKSIMGASFPIVVWVGPSGSRAGSAGAFITLAGHVAAMAPGTNIGAAHPIQASGQDIEQGEAQRKVVNDTIAFIETIAQARGRNVDMARSFVATSVSITEEEALKHDVIDLIARDLDDLFEKIDGREVELQNGVKQTLATSGAARVTYEKSLKQLVLEILSNPNFFYLLFMAGLIGLGYELTHPGALFPGVAGAICMILALIAMSVLPISYGAIVLILVGIALLIAEVFVPSFGILGIGGFVAFVLGSIFLVDPSNEQGLRISLWTIAPASIGVSVAFLALGYLVLKATRAPVRSGRESMIGETATVIADFEGARGQVRVQGAIWEAVVSDPSVPPLRRGDQVIVRKVDGLLLTVEPVNQAKAVP